MRILTVHNYYGNYAPGGEGNVFDAEKQLLRAHGHEVKAYVRTNSEFMRRGCIGRLKLAWEAAWSKQAHKAIQAEIRRLAPDVMHVHNYWLMLSPSIFRAAKELGVATVLTAHNYRLACPAGQFLRDGHVCEDCLGRHPWRVVPRRCYRGGVMPSILAYRLSQASRKRRVFQSDVDAVVALTEFAKGKLAAAGIPPDIIHVKPNFLADPLQGGCPSPPGNGALFVGRLSREKGAGTLLQAWRDLAYPLTIAGDGPLREELQEIAPPGVRFLGWVGPEDVLGLMRSARFAVLPSTWYEGFPCALVECFAMGRAVVASRLGAMAEIITDGRTGLLFEPGDSDDCRKKVMRMIHEPGLAEQLGRRAREDYLRLCTPGRNYGLLMNIYRAAMKRRRAA